MPAFGYSQSDLRRLNSGEPFAFDSHQFMPWKCAACGRDREGTPAVAIEPCPPDVALYLICDECNAEFAGLDEDE